MNILVVDDDRFVLEGIRKGIDWKSMPFDHLYMAQSAKQAREIMEKIPIAVLVSDIEMPQESGLDLLFWVREKQLTLESILLTSYAEFRYAQKAVELGSFHYFLKPIAYHELREIIIQAAEKAEKEIEQNHHTVYRQMWLDQMKHVKEFFWTWITDHKADADEDSIQYQIRSGKLSYSPKDEFLPIFLELNYDHEDELWRDSLKEFAFRNITEEMAADGGFHLEAICRNENQRYYLILRGDMTSAYKKEIEHFLRAVINACKKVLHCFIFCVVGNHSRISEIGDNMQLLEQVEQNALSFRDTVIFADDFTMEEGTPELPNSDEMVILLETGNLNELLKRTDHYLNSMERAHILSESLLANLRYDMIQMVFSRLSKEQVNAHELMNNAEMISLEKESVHSAAGMRRYLSELFRTAIEYGSFAEDHRSITEKLIAYIEDHLNENISRADLAEVVFLNEDYLARVFKQEVGIPVGTYILNRKMERARHMITSTDKPIHQIAIELGYDGTSYFSKLFRRAYQMTPHEYRSMYSVTSSSDPLQ